LVATLPFQNYSMTTLSVSPWACVLFACTDALALHASAAAAQAMDVKTKLLSSAKDPVGETVLIGRSVSEGLTKTLEIEGAEAMWMQMGTPSIWSKHT